MSVTLFVISSSGFPVMLKAILEDETIVKVGVGINSDVDKISREYDVYPRGIVDLSALANTKLKSHENWSLSGLTMHLFKQQLNKDPAIRCSNCEAIPLTREQQLYAAMDAYVGLLIYKRLVANQLRYGVHQLDK
ncbi:Werner syndrome ATP-dependent helicase homolog isoform X3 [Nematostella vectensis]|uniref:Werner syndrome ATP-dependent helicase homolog isoform X3 n=1 Tax=Nematostella vectensis TaxID=45351 RepID=UPI00138F9F26|nr:Werner syndrome ATP-dependent helicase homolog isoform X3 [Nematostella vectensis]XP_048580279.1 Werner syndrome ATP-dependent helicase homolog isoform X3 [Nematostella vectensis]